LIEARRITRRKRAMTLDEMIAQAEIRQTMADYNIAGDRLRFEELAAQFTEDGVIRFAGVTARGRAEIVRALSGVPAGEGSERPRWTKVRHNLTTSQVIIEGEEARGRTYFFVVTDQGPDHQGVYVDRFRKEGGRWLIAERECRVDWIAGGISG
jgi:hypothetical protein